MTINGVSGVQLHWLRLSAPNESDCVSQDQMIHVLDAQNASLLSNRIRAGRARGSCGYVVGILVEGASSARIQYNLVENFQQVGIHINGDSNTSATVVTNSIHYYLDQPPVTASSAARPALIGGERAIGIAVSGGSNAHIARESDPLPARRDQSRGRDAGADALRHLRRQRGRHGGRPRQRHSAREGGHLLGQPRLEDPAGTSFARWTPGSG